MKYNYARPLKALRDQCRISTRQVAGETQATSVSRAECAGPLSEALLCAMVEAYGVTREKIINLHAQTRQNKHDAENPETYAVRLIRDINERVVEMEKTIEGLVDRLNAVAEAAKPRAPEEKE